MREILFKGKTLNTHKWIYGGYYTMGGRKFIVAECEFEVNWDIDDAYKKSMQRGYRLYEVDPNSVGQYIGQKDSVGDPIFENDIVYVPAEDEYAEVVWDEHTSKFILNFDVYCNSFDNFYGHELEVAGNTFEGKWWEET